MIGCDGHSISTPLEFFVGNIPMDFGTGIPLRQFSRHLRNDAVRHEMILNCVERNSVIEGLPRFTKESRTECLREIRKVSKQLKRPSKSAIN